MINKIIVKNVATYDTEGIVIDKLEKVNYIYGANGCGKTTISTLLEDTACEKFSDCQVEWDHNLPEKVFVYNKTFREKNFKESSDIAGIFTLGQATTEEIEEINRKKAELEENTHHIKGNNETIEDLRGKIEKEKSDFKEIIWKDVYKTNEDKFKEAFSGFLKKEAFASKLKELALPEKENITREDVEKRAAKLFGEPPVKKEQLFQLSKQYIMQIESLAIWDKCIVGKKDIPIARLIIQLENGDWVNQGRKYIYSGSKCPFCQKDTIDEDFRSQLEAFFDLEFENDIEQLKKGKEEYLRAKDDIRSKLAIIENQDLENETKFKIQQLCEKIVNCFRDNEEKINRKINEPSKKIQLDSIEKYIDEINCIIDIKNAEIIKHNNLVENYKTEKKKLIDDIWILIAKENMALISKHNNKINGFMKGIQETTNKKNQHEVKKKELELEIKEKNKLVTSVQPAVDEINGILKSYGFNNFSIDPSKEKNNHYQIKRPDGTLVESTLSEGEVTFITFLYFLQWIKGSQNEEDVTQDRVIVIDDPISSLDSNILFVVSSLLKDVIRKVLVGESNIKQVFVLTHNVYFHKELSFMGNGKDSNKNIHYWILRKKNGITNIQYYGIENPISSSYELLWKELKEQNNNSVITIQNTMRRIIENYFKILGKYKDEDLIDKFQDYESKEICRSLISWINDGSHCIPDDLYVEALDDSLERYQEVFRMIFFHTNHIEHYNMMMGIKE